MTGVARTRTYAAAMACTCLAGVAALGGAGAQAGTGGASYRPPPPPPKKAKIVRGKAIAPRSAPLRVKRVIKYANRLVRKPYRYGGGHRPFSSRLDSGYDCSGSISYALYGGRFLRSPLDSRGFMRWGRRGRGRWITVYTHGGHAYLVVAGLRFDTSMRDRNAPRPRSGPRWSKRKRSPAGFRARRPRGY